MTRFKIPYEKSLLYEINLSAKCFNLLFEQFFKDLNIGLSATEHLALNVIIETKDCCQRDLARIILKDRANTGKLANSLKEKGLVKIEQKTKNNRLVKILIPTKKGKEVCKEIIEKVEPIIDEITSKISKKVMDETIKTLKSFRSIVEQSLKVNI